MNPRTTDPIAIHPTPTAAINTAAEVHAGRPMTGVHATDTRTGPARGVPARGGTA